jgi:cytidylate kinase
LSFCVAIDGPAAAGKGTIARAVASQFRFAYLDTGSLYRAVGLLVLRAGEDPADPVAAETAALSLEPEKVAEMPLRDDLVAEAASKVAAIPEVRRALLETQRAFSRRVGGAVLDGRDIGTVVRPDAEAKLFVTASPEVRAARRAAELGLPVEKVLEDLKARDARDAERADAPMVPARDAYLLDTTDLAIDAAVAEAAALITRKLNEARANTST